MAELGFHYSDLYPGMSALETSTMANPDTNDQEALNEDAAVAKEASAIEARPKMVLIALGLIAAFVVFFGGK